jgi:hypothetical protein
MLLSKACPSLDECALLNIQRGGRLVLLELLEFFLAKQREDHFLR